VKSAPTGLDHGGESGESGDRGSRWRRVDPPIAMFAVVECGALVLWIVLGRSQWFYLDEWDFLAGRRAGDLGDLFRPHNEHWTTVPIVVYRVLYWLFGLRTYFPYRLIVVLLHLVAAALLMVVMRRAQVRPWIATAAASLFVLFGAGWQNIVQPFQMCFTGALVFGLGHLLCADHDGPIDRRDWLGCLAGLVGLMMSGIAVSMVVIVGIAVLLRRGWRLALFHTAPLAACYLAWFLAIGKDGYTTQHRTVPDVIRFVTTGLRAAYSAIGQLPGAGIAVAMVLIVGLAIALRQRARSGQLRQLAGPVALLTGSLIVLAITATGRLAHGSEYARQSRYLHLVAAMTLPALAVAADALVTQWRPFSAAAILLFVIGIPGNVTALSDGLRTLTPVEASFRQMILALPRDPLARQVPRTLRPEKVTARDITIGWLLDGVAQHRIPELTHPSARTLATDRFRLSFDQQRTRSPTTTCRLLTHPFTTTLKKGDVIAFYDKALLITPAIGLQLVGPPLLFVPNDGSAVIMLRDTGRVRLAPGNTAFFPPRICGTRVGSSSN
jgi:hypothetical protein